MVSMVDTSAINYKIDYCILMHVHEIIACRNQTQNTVAIIGMGSIH